VFKRKLSADGCFERFKASLVLKGFQQRSNVDDDAMFAPVVRMSTVCLFYELMLNMLRLQKTLELGGHENSISVRANCSHAMAISNVGTYFLHEVISRLMFGLVCKRPNELSFF
jgi:hypothetical protein